MVANNGNNNQYVLGIDVGTSGTKALLMDGSGRIAGQGYKGYKLYSEGKCIEQEADDWWNACIAAVRQAVSGNDASRVIAISLSTQGASMVALDAMGKPMGRALTWMDGRSFREAEELESRLGEGEVYRICGWRSAPSLDAPKILWMKNHGYGEAKLFLSTIEYINLKLSGRAVIDPTNAAIRQLYNVNEGCWDERILDAVGVGKGELPEILKTKELIGSLTVEAASILGLPETVRLYNGAHDQYCASIGCGAVNSGDMLLSTGTAWVIMGITDKPIFSDTFISPCSHPAGKVYGNIASLSGAGASYQWIKDLYLPNESFLEIDEKAVNERSRCGNLFFLPWLSGAAYPIWNMDARGGFIGMDLSTNPYCMALAVMEAIAFSLKYTVQDFRKYGFNPKAIKIMGGAAKSRVWLDILTAVIDIPFYKMEITDSCAMGAALIAACGEGWYKDYASAAGAVVAEEMVRESKADRNYYLEKYLRYIDIVNSTIKLYPQGGKA